MKKVSILQLSVTTILGGGSEVVYNLSNSIGKFYDKEYEYEVIVACPSDGVFFDRMKDLGVSVYDLPLRNLLFSNLIEIRRICKRHDIDIIHTHGKGAGLFGRLVAFVCRIPVVHSFHGFHFEHLQYVYSKIYLLYEFMFSFLTTAFIFVSEGERRKFLSSVPFVGNSKVHIVHNGIDPDRMKFPVVSRSDYGLLNDEIVIITMARMTSQKGLEFLINAFYILKKTLHKCQLKLIIAGDDLKKEVDGHDSENLYRNEIFTLIETLDLSSSVIVRKKSYDVLQLVSVCDYYVSSSLGEGFSLSIVEAMLLRLPIIATNVTGNNDAIEDNVSGILVSPENSCEISDALFTVINNHAYASDLANNAYIRANRMFSYNSMINKTISVYKKILYV